MSPAARAGRTSRPAATRRGPPAALRRIGPELRGRPARSRTAPCPFPPTGCPRRCRRTRPSMRPAAPALRAPPRVPQPPAAPANDGHRGRPHPRGTGSGCGLRSPSMPRSITLHRWRPHQAGLFGVLVEPREIARANSRRAAACLLDKGQRRLCPRPAIAPSAGRPRRRNRRLAASEGPAGKPFSPGLLAVFRRSPSPMTCEFVPVAERAHTRRCDARDGRQAGSCRGHLYGSAPSPGGVRASTCRCFGYACSIASTALMRARCRLQIQVGPMFRLHRSHEERAVRALAPPPVHRCPAPAPPHTSMGFAQFEPTPCASR